MCDKKLYKLIKDRFNLEVKNLYADGVIKITRVKITQRYDHLELDDYVCCEVDIIYEGTIRYRGTVMGPKESKDKGYPHKWRTVVIRNQELRRALTSDIVDHLKYFGLFFRWRGELRIKKIVW